MLLSWDSAEQRPRQRVQCVRAQTAAPHWVAARDDDVAQLPRRRHAGRAVLRRDARRGRERDRAVGRASRSTSSAAARAAGTQLDLAQRAPSSSSGATTPSPRPADIRPLPRLLHAATTRRAASAPPGLGARGHDGLRWISRRQSPERPSRCFAVSAVTLDGHESVWSGARARHAALRRAQRVRLHHASARRQLGLPLRSTIRRGTLGVVDALTARSDLDFTIERHADGSLWFSPARTGVTMTALFDDTGRRSHVDRSAPRRAGSPRSRSRRSRFRICLPGAEGGRRAFRRGARRFRDDRPTWCSTGRIRAPWERGAAIIRAPREYGVIRASEALTPRSALVLLGNCPSSARARHSRSMTNEVVIDGNSLTLEQVTAVARDRAPRLPGASRTPARSLDPQQSSKTLVANAPSRTA